MKTLVSIKISALIHFFPGELAPDLQLAAQLLHDFVVTLHALARVGVVRKPAAELLVQSGVLGTRALTRSLDQTLPGTQGDIFHVLAGKNHAGIGYTITVR